MKNIIFNNYHKHSCYTNVRISDCAVQLEEYAKRAKELGHSILSSVEHGFQGNQFEVMELAKKYELKPVIGAEAYWVKDRSEKDRSNCHICIIAKNENGRQALNDVLSEANLTGFYGQPRLDVDLILSLPPEDVIITTACVAFWRYDDIECIIQKFAEHFRYFYLEVQYHDVDTQRELNQRILELKNKLHIPIIMGCDSHYIYPEQSQARTDFLLSKGMDYPDEENWFLDYPDGNTAYERFANQCVLSHEEILEAINNTLIFNEVEEYDSPVFNDDIKLPSLYPDWTQEQKNEEYKRLVWAGWDEYKKDIPENKWDEYIEEINKEIQVVIDTYMADYFICDYHIMKQGKANGGWLTKSGRGSGASFFTNTLLGFSDIDRISATVHMYPERFMSTTRILESKGIPDIDMNEAPTAPFVQAQAEVLGQDHSYPMVAYGTMKNSAAWKLYAKSQGIPFEIANAISEQLKRYELAVKHADEDEKDDIDVNDYIGKEYKEIYDKSKSYLGLITSWSIAPCSSLIYMGSIRKEIGLVKVKDNICCLLDGHAAEKGHFLKNDHLKVSVVDLIYKAYHRIGIEPPKVKDLLAMCPPEDTAWDIFQNGCTIGINQCERDGTRARVMKYKPRNISELSAFVAAIRPGGASYYKKFESREPFSYGVKAFDDLIQTKEFPYSFLLYQEQIMKALNYAGIDMAECYTAIKNIAKKRVEKVLVYKEKFIDGFTAAIIGDGKSKEEADMLANQLWKVIEDASGYSFNCISEDTRLMSLGVNGNGFNPTVGEMYRIKHDVDYAKNTGHFALHKKYRRKDVGYGKSMSLFEDHRIKPNRILDIRPAGIKQVYLVRTRSGRTIECTAEHKILTPHGKIEIKNLHNGDTIYVCGTYEKDKTHYLFTNGSFEDNYPRKGERGFQRKSNGASVIYKMTRENHIKQKDPCERCKTPYEPRKRFELHHVDLDRTHNELSNYMWLCPSCHKKTHFETGRRKRNEKGYPVEVDIIETITATKRTMTYDVEMDSPAHNFCVDNGIVVSNCSHSYCVAIDALYGAWLKAHHPLAFYETYMKLMEEKGDKDKMNALKEEAESYFKIKFPPFRFGQDNRQIKADENNNSILNSIASIKGFSNSVGATLYSCSKQNFTSFVDVLNWLDKHSIKAAKVRPLITINYFQDFGNENELLMLLDFWDFMKQGEAKSIKKEKVTSPVLKMIFDKNCSATKKDGSDATSYKVDGMVMQCLYDLEQYIKRHPIKPPTMKERLKYSTDVLGYADVVTGKEEDRRRLLITDVTSVSDSSGNVWAYRIGTRSLGSGKTARLTVKKDIFEKNKIIVGDIIYAAELFKNKSGYWYLTAYKKET